MGIILALPFVLFLMLFLPWLALLAVPIATCAVSGVFVFRGINSLLASGRTAEAIQQGLLALVGLDLEPRLESIVRGTIGRSLAFAPAGTRAGACACVKPADGAFVGIVRMWNNRGEYLLRTPGESLAAVANAIVEQLHAFGDRFPAREGATRVQVHECDPRACPLRQLRTIARAQLA